MVFFNLFKGKGQLHGDEAQSIKAAASAEKWAEKATDRRAQVYDRQEALHKLSAMGTKEAVACLLKRFTFQVDPSITDQEEKELAFRGILEAGDKAFEPLRQFVKKADSLAWPMRIIKELRSEEEYVGELISWLSQWDTEYSKFIDPKLQLLSALEEHKDERIVAAILPFLEDVNEPTRFHAVATLLVQQDEGSFTPLLNMFLNEESVRIRNKVCEGLTLFELAIPKDKQDWLRERLPHPYKIDSEGIIRKK